MENLLRQLNGHYPMAFDRVLRNRDMGSTSKPLLATTVSTYK